MDELLPKIQEWLALYGLRILAAIAILLLGRVAAAAVRRIIRRILRRSRTDATIVSFVSSLAFAALMTFVIIAALGQLGVQTASFVAVLGAAGLAVGLSLQASLSNFASGVLMIIFKPFEVGHFVEAAGQSGTVTSIGIFTTELLTPDNRKVIIPNSKLTADNIVNYSAMEIRRIDIVASVSYSDDLGRVRRVLEEMLASDERVLEEPPPMVGVLRLAESSIDMAVRPWVRTDDYWAVHFHLQEEIKRRFDAEGITIPFPQRDVNLRGPDAR